MTTRSKHASAKAATGNARAGHVAAKTQTEGTDCPGLVTHLNWALGLDESRLPAVLAIVSQWKNPSEGAAFFNACESMAEKKFALGLLLDGVCESVEWRKLVDHRPCAIVRRDSRSIIVAPQYQRRNFRVDFILGHAHPSDDWFTETLAVEIDGHDWHERTKEQAAADRARDRSLLAECIHTIRFTGAEVNASPSKCAAEALDLFSGMMSRALTMRDRAISETWSVAGRMMKSEVRDGFYAGRRCQRVLRRDVA
jgi:very-short-patch-repair endonuclease